MKNYSWSYGIFHWFVHYTLTLVLYYSLLATVQITILPQYFPFTVFNYQLSIFGFESQGNLIDIVILLFTSSIIDLDHLQFLRKFGFRKYIWQEKRLTAPLHNFFFLSVLSIASTLAALFVSKAAGVILFSIVLHIIWDIFEDVVIFKTSFRRWEKTWGLNTKDLEDTYNEFMQYEAQQPKKESRISTVRKIGSRLKEKISRKKKASVVATMELS